MYLSRMEDDSKDFHFDDDSFYSIVQEDDKDQDGNQSTVIRVNPITKTQTSIGISLERTGSLHSPTSGDRLKWKHPMVPFPKPVEAMFKLPVTKGLNPFWENEFRFSEKGEMISINEKKLEAQKGVLSHVAKTMGRNLFTGKSILNVSLPVTIFSY